MVMTRVMALVNGAVRSYFNQKCLILKKHCKCIQLQKSNNYHIKASTCNIIQSLVTIYQDGKKIQNHNTTQLINHHLP